MTKPKREARPDAGQEVFHVGKVERTITQTMDLRFFRWGLTIFVLLATSVPYVLNWLATPPNFHYTWILPPYPEDSYGYLSWLQQAAHGNLLFQIKYTGLSHSAFLFHPFFLICGWLSALFQCDGGVVLWMAKSVGVVLFFVTFFKYSDFLGLNRLESVVASLLIGVSSGLGGLFVFLSGGEPLPIVSADLWMPEMSTFWSLLWNALFPYSLTLTLLTIYWLDRGTRSGRKSDFWLSGLSTGILALIHPYSQVLLYFFAGTIIFLRRGTEAWSCLCRYFLAAFPFALYLILIVVLEPLVSKHSSQGRMPSPLPLEYLLGFGIPLLLCVAGLLAGRLQLVKRYWQIILWFLLCLIFAYLPVWYQRKFILGAHIPLCILAGISVNWILTLWVRRSMHRWVLITAAVILLPLIISTPIYLLISQNREVKANADHRAYYLSDDTLAALKFLKEKTKPDEIVFASMETSRLIPAYSGNTVLWGHWAMSIDVEDRIAWFQRLFQDPSNWNDPKRADEFWGTGIKYILADGPVTQHLKQDPPEWKVILKKADVAFTNGSVIIYRYRANN